MTWPENVMFMTTVMCRVMWLLYWPEKCQGAKWLWDSVPKLECAADQAPTRSHLTHSSISTHIERVSVSSNYQRISSERSLCRIQSLKWCTASMPINQDRKPTRPGIGGGANLRPYKYERKYYSLQKSKNMSNTGLAIVSPKDWYHRESLWSEVMTNLH